MFRIALLSTTALAVASSAGFAVPYLLAKSTPALPKGAIAVSSINGVAVGIMLHRPHTTATMPTGGPRAHAPAKNATFNNLGKDPNAQFLSWYGYQTYNYETSTCSGANCTYTSSYERLAIPITGAGKAVTNIKVPNAGAKFTVALYTNGTNGPGSPIAGASGTASGVNSSYCCTELVTVNIHKTVLNSGTQYWIVENGAGEKNVKNTVTWLAENTDFTPDTEFLVQQHYFRSLDGVVETNYTSGWQSTTTNHWTQPAAEVE
jgi:hypothetical protein